MSLIRTFVWEPRMEPHPATPTYLSISQFSARSGLSVPTLRRYVRDGKIKALQPGGRGAKLLFPLNALESLTSVQPQVLFSTASQLAKQSRRPLAGRAPAWTTAGLANSPTNLED